jgi:predicted phage tail protein
MEKEIRLYGPLAKFIGQRKFLAEISSAGEAIRMLLANFPGLERHMADQHYKVIVDNYETDLDEIHYPASQVIKLVPVLGGAGSGTGKILAGVALVAASSFWVQLAAVFWDWAWDYLVRMELLVALWQYLPEQSVSLMILVAFRSCFHQRRNLVKLVRLLNH